MEEPQPLCLFCLAFFSVCMNIVAQRTSQKRYKTKDAFNFLTLVGMASPQLRSTRIARRRVVNHQTLSLFLLGCIQNKANKVFSKMVSVSLLLSSAVVLLCGHSGAPTVHGMVAGTNDEHQHPHHPPSFYLQAEPLNEQSKTKGNGGSRDRLPSLQESFSKVKNGKSADGEDVPFASSYAIKGDDTLAATIVVTKLSDMGDPSGVVTSRSGLSIPEEAAVAALQHSLQEMVLHSTNVAKMTITEKLDLLYELDADLQSKQVLIDQVAALTNHTYPDLKVPLENSKGVVQQYIELSPQLHEQMEKYSIKRRPRSIVASLGVAHLHQETVSQMEVSGLIPNSIKEGHLEVLARTVGSRSSAHCPNLLVRTHITTRKCPFLTTTSTIISFTM
jgi:hypothetical protein